LFPRAPAAPPGLGIVAVSPRAMERIMTRTEQQPRSWYMDLKRWQWFVENWGDWHHFPVTMPTSVVMALRAALLSLMREGVAARIARYEQMASDLRAGLQEMGMRLFVDESLMTPTITSAYCPEGINAVDIKNYLMKEHNIQITNGFANYKEFVIRIGHMGGAIQDSDINQLLAGLQEFMRQRV
jgi:alanine-glyoxylate transaminase / serine-glyoxylate transaminase / serine-pyruvate transaminase